MLSTCFGGSFDGNDKYQSPIGSALTDLSESSDSVERFESNELPVSSTCDMDFTNGTEKFMFVNGIFKRNRIYRHNS